MIRLRSTSAVAPLAGRLVVSAAFLLVCAGAVGLARGSGAQTPGGVPAVDNALRGFRAISDYRLVVDGKPVLKAEIYKSERAAALLLISSEFPSPVLVSPGSRAAESLDLMRVMKKPDGTVDVLADATLSPLGAVTVAGQEVSFKVGAKSAKLVANPWLLSWQTSSALLDSAASYGIKARAYQPDAAAIKALRGAPETRVLVFFGSWCPHCQENLPRLLRVQQEIGASRIQFEYYGLPSWPAAGQDAQARKFNIDGVPTAIVLRGEKELGRIETYDWSTPDQALRAKLGL